MSTLFALFPADRFVRIIATAPDMPPEVRQLANQINTRLVDALTDFTRYGLFTVALAASVTLLVSSLLLVLQYPYLPAKAAQPILRTVNHAPSVQPSKRLPGNRIARANRYELRRVSDRIQAGQLSN